MRQFHRYFVIGGITLLLCLSGNSVIAQEILQIPPLALEYYHQGVFYGKNGKYVEAIMELEKAVEAYPEYADAHNALGVVYSHQQQPQEAIEQYLLAIEINPRHAKARTNLAIIYKEQAKYQQSLDQLRQALNAHPSYAAAQKLLPLVQQLLDEQKAAEAKARAEAEKNASPVKSVTITSTPPSKATPRPTSKSTSSPASFFEKGTVIIRQGNIDAGIEEYRKGLSHLPCSAEGLTLLGMAYREKFRITQQLTWQQEEIMAFQKAIQCDPTYIPAVLGLAETFYAQKDYVNATRYFQYVLQFQPDHPAREQIEALLGR